MFFFCSCSFTTIFICLVIVIVKTDTRCVASKEIWTLLKVESAELLSQQSGSILTNYWCFNYSHFTPFLTYVTFWMKNLFILFLFIYFLKSFTCIWQPWLQATCRITFKSYKQTDLIIVLNTKYSVCVELLNKFHTVGSAALKLVNTNP